MTILVINTFRAGPAARLQVFSCPFRCFAYGACALTHCATSTCPYESAAPVHLAASHGQPCSRAHFSTSRCPLLAAKKHVLASHGQSCSRAQRNTSRCPLRAAEKHVSVSHGQSFSRAHRNTSRQGLTLVHAVVQRKHFLWDRGCGWGLFWGCLRGRKRGLGVSRVCFCVRNGSG